MRAIFDATAVKGFCFRSERLRISLIKAAMPAPKIDLTLPDGDLVRTRTVSIFVCIRALLRQPDGFRFGETANCGRQLAQVNYYNIFLTLIEFIFLSIPS